MCILSEKLVSSSLFSQLSVENEYRELNFPLENRILDIKLYKISLELTVFKLNEQNDYRFKM